jgi:putative isomerase
MDIEKYIQPLKDNITQSYRETLRPAGENLEFPFITPGSKQYPDILWDWDAWLSNVALRQTLTNLGDQAAFDEALPHEQGCVLNYIKYSHQTLPWLGYLPGTLTRDKKRELPEGFWKNNPHKPTLAQHAALIAQGLGGDVSWLIEHDAIYTMQTLMNYYKNHQRHKETGLILMKGPGNGGPDDDPTVFCRPKLSTATIFINSLMYRELRALVYLMRQANLNEAADFWEKDADQLRDAIREHCYDERDGFFYSFDVNLEPEKPNDWYHSGRHRHWPGLIMRIETWMGFMPLWAEIATQEQAERVVEHYRDQRTFNCEAGVRTLSKMEKMYLVQASGNPSCWLGPVWGASNYLTWRGLVRYGFQDDARELAEKTIWLFGRDLERRGALHEYYQPDGEPLLNPGFQNWNHLVLNMIAWYEGAEEVVEF